MFGEEGAQCDPLNKSVRLRFYDLRRGNAVASPFLSSAEQTTQDRAQDAPSVAINQESNDVADDAGGLKAEGRADNLTYDAPQRVGLHRAALSFEDVGEIIVLVAGIAAPIVRRQGQRGLAGAEAWRLVAGAGAGWEAGEAAEDVVEGGLGFFSKGRECQIGDARQHAADFFGGDAGFFGCAIRDQPAAVLRLPDLIEEVVAALDGVGRGQVRVGL